MVNLKTQFQQIA